MRIGIVVPQGWTGEYRGRTAVDAWARTCSVATEADRLGFDSVWVFDHFHTIPEPADEITFESFMTLGAIAATTRRVGLGHLVLSAGFRSPALVAKMIGTLDVVSGGRAELGIGAGWKEDEWRAYGFPFPPLGERLDALGDQLEVITRMLAPGRATYEGSHASVHGAINVPRGIREPRVPVMLGGNGPNVTWRLAARFADELNLDSLRVDEVAAALPVVASRCEEVGRDPASLPVSVHLWWEYLPGAGPARVDLLGRYRALGVRRVMLLVREAADDVGEVERLAEDALAAGLELGSRVG